MRSRFCLLAATAAVAIGSGSAGADELAEGQVRIELRAQFVARSQEVRLGDIAYLRTTDLPTIRRLSALSLGQAPAVGSEAVVRREVVGRWVRSQLGLARDKVLWIGPDQTTVRTLAQELPAVRVEQAATVALKEWLDQRTTRYAIEVRALPSDLKLPAGEVRLNARPLAADGEPAPRMVVWMDVKVDGRFVRAVPVSFTIEAFRQAGVVVGARSAPAVARGDWVDLRLKSGLVELERRAQALQQGELGQVVKVRSTGSAGPVEARVVAPGRVEAML